MDGSRFDGITRALATGATRRQALLGVAGSAVAGLLGLATVEDTAAGCVKPGNTGCKGPRNKRCCSGAVCQGGNRRKEGRCKCKGSLTQCGDKCVNTKKDKKNCAGCDRRCTGQNTCKNGVCTSALGCKRGQNFCDNISLDDLCPGRDDCACITAVTGTAFCSDFTSAACSDCTSNADCPPGHVCIDASGACNCDEQPGSNGNACVISSCQGISPSSTRGPKLRTPVFR